MSLSCGGRGPCCHVGYAHRHCEHCDTVIAVSVQPHSHGYPWYGYPYPWGQMYGGSLLSGISSQLTMQSLQTNPFQALQSAATQVPIDYPVTD